MLQRMFSPTINQTLPASIPQLQTAPHRRQKPNQWWVAWGRLGELARSRRRTRLKGWFVSGPPGGTSSLWSTRSGGNVSFGPSAIICIRFFFVGGKLWLLLQHTQGTAGIRGKLDQIGHSSSSSCIATKPGEGLVLRALSSCSLRDLQRSATTNMRGGIKPGLHDLACHTAGCFEPKRPGSKRINCHGCDQRYSNL